MPKICEAVTVAKGVISMDQILKVLCVLVSFEFNVVQEDLYLV